MAKATPLDNVLAVGATPAPAAPFTMSPQQMQQAVSTSASMMMHQGEQEMYALHKRLTEEPRVKVMLSPMYRPYFGNVMPVGNGGIMIYFPIDGKSYDVPKSYAMIIHARRRAVDAHITRKTRLADVQNNFETSAGELKFF